MNPHDKPLLYTTPQEAEPRLTSDEFDELTQREPTDDELCNPSVYSFDTPGSLGENDWRL